MESFNWKENSTVYVAHRQIEKWTSCEVYVQFLVIVYRKVHDWGMVSIFIGVFSHNYVPRNIKND